MIDPNAGNNCCSRTVSATPLAQRHIDDFVTTDNHAHAHEYKCQLILRWSDDLKCDRPNCSNSIQSSTTKASLKCCSECCSCYFCSDSCYQIHSSLSRDSMPYCTATTQKIKKVQLSIANMTTTAIDTNPDVAANCNNLSMNFSFAKVTANRNDPNYPSNEKCSICLDSFDDENNIDESPNNEYPVVVLQGKCNHSFCLSCLVKWNRFGSANNANTPLVLPQAESFNKSLHPTQYVPIIDCGIGTMNFPLPSAIYQKLLCCPICRAETQDIEHWLLRRSLEICQETKSGGCCPTTTRTSCLDQADRVVAELINIDGFHLQAYYIQAEIKLKQGKPNEALASLAALIREDRRRHESIANNPVLARIEQAQYAFSKNDYPNMMLALKAAGDEADRSGCPPKPPPCLRGRDRQQIYRLTTLLRAEAFQHQENWMKSMSALRNILTNEQENQVLVASTGRQDILFGDEDAVTAKIWKLIALSSYKLQAFDASIDASRRCLAIDRTMSGGVYYTLLRSTLRSVMEKDGNDNKKELILYSSARRIIRDAILYEAPWDTKRFLENRNLYESLSGSGGTQESLDHLFSSLH